MNGIYCAKCSAPLRSESFTSDTFARCPRCKSPVRAEVFPALVKTQESGGTGQRVMEGAEAGCFYHPKKRAAVACESCGRFLCELCDLEIQGRHLCSNCLQSGKKKGKLRDLERERVLYDSIALSLAILPLLLWPSTIITAPAAIYIAIRYWNAPTSILPRGKVRFIFAIIIALLEITGWLVLLYFLIFHRR